MIFKDERQRPLYNERADGTLRNVLHILDYYSLLISNKDIVVTEFWREERAGRLSFHPIFQAADIRTKRRSQEWIKKMIGMLIVLKEDDSRIQFEYEDVGGNNEHLHIEIDTGNPV